MRLGWDGMGCAERGGMLVKGWGVPSYPILSYPSLAHPILSYPILSGRNGAYQDGIRSGSSGSGAREWTHMG